MKIRVAAACVPDIKGDKERNFSAAADLTKRLALEGADMVVLPEACLQGYPAGAERFSRSEIVEMGEPFEGTYAQGFRDLAREASVYLVAGYDRRAGEILYNSAELIAPNGKTIGLYDKTHVMVGGDLGLYTPGASLSAFETGFGKVGLLICNDRVYSECWRVLLLQGAQIVLIPSNGGYSQMNTNRLQVMALDNCLCCTNDIEALEYYLAGCENWGEIASFIQSDQERSLHLVDNVVPLHLTPLLTEIGS